MEELTKIQINGIIGSPKKLKISLLLFVLVCLCFSNLQSLAWEQDEHMEINRIAYEKFLSLYKQSDKFKLSPIDQQLKYPGPYTTSSSLFQSGRVANALLGPAAYLFNFSDYKVESQFHTLQGWVTHGGYSADEPEMYASVRHFYDPTVNDHPELTDQGNLHGYYDYAVSADLWAYTHPDNAFSFMKGLEYYKKAMEIPEDGAQPSVIPASGGDGSFRDMTFTPEHSEHARRFYLGKAFRALGESMHMISDMAMPAHVRNDAHPYFDSIETPLKPENITASSVYTAEPIDLSGTPMQNFITLAKYTNAHFFTDETISIPEKNVTPSNEEKKYESPRLEDLLTVVSGDRTSYYQLFSQDPISIPILVESKNLLSGTSFSVPAELGPSLCDKLVPLAIKASYRTMYEFFPSIELSIISEEENVSEDEAALRLLKKIVLSSTLIHEVENDRAWVEARFQIHYSGPGALYRQRKHQKEKIADLIYENGELTGIRTSGKDKKFSSFIGPVVLYVAKPNTRAVAPKGFPKELAYKNFMIQIGDSLSVEINAGGRKITCEPYTYKHKDVEVTIQPPRIITYELMPGADSAEHTFEAMAEPKNEYRFEWDFGDGSPLEHSQGRDSCVQHTYTELGEYNPVVSLYEDGTSNILSSDRVTLIVKCELPVNPRFRFEDPKTLYLKGFKHLGADHSFFIEYFDPPPNAFLEVDFGDGLAPYKYTSYRNDDGTFWFSYHDYYYAEEGAYTVTASMYSQDGKMIAQDSILVIVILEEAIYEISPVVPSGD